MTVVSDLIQKCIYENAHVALDQVEYQKRYDGLTARFDTAKARYEALDETIRSKQSRRAKIEAFLEALAKAELVDTFDTALWCGLVDFVTVHGKMMCDSPSKTDRKSRLKDARTQRNNGYRPRP